MMLADVKISVPIEMVSYLFTHDQGRSFDILVKSCMKNWGIKSEKVTKSLKRSIGEGTDGESVVVKPSSMPKEG